jgi:hypothetical protein
VNREQLSHLLRAVADATGDVDILVIGSQAILGSIDEVELPPEATMSMEADLAFFDDPDERKSDLVDGVVGELSKFHESFGFYGQGVSIATAVVPDGWRERLVRFEGPATAGARGWCLEPHDLTIAKLVRGDPKDYRFADALVRAGLVGRRVLADRFAVTGGIGEATRVRIGDWIRSVSPH